MPLPSSTTFPNQVYIPKQWSAKTLLRYYAEDILPQITNTDYSGEFSKKGDLVHIPYEPFVVAQDHIPDADLNWQNIQDVEKTLSIDYDKVISVSIPDEWQRLSLIDLANTVTNAMRKKMGEVIQETLLNTVYTSATSTASTLNWSTAGNPSKSLAECSAKLSTLKIPMANRWLLLHPNQVQYLIQEVANFALNAGNPKGALIEGWVGHFAGFDVYQSPLIPGAGTAGNPYKSMAGHRDAISLATIIKDIKVKDLSNKLNQGIVMQSLYGFGVLQPDALVYLPGQVS